MKSTLLCSFFVAAAAMASSAVAGDLKVYHVGNSLTGDLMNGFRFAATTYQTNLGNTYTWGTHFKAGSALAYEYTFPTGQDYGSRTASVTGQNTNYQWHDPGDPNANPPVAPNGAPLVPWTTSLPQNHWDAVTLQFGPGQIGPPTNAQVTQGDEVTAINGFISSTRSNSATTGNNSTKFYLYQTWTEDPHYLGVTSVAQYWNQATANSSSTQATRTRAYAQNLFNAVKAAPANSGVSLSMIPVGEVFYALEQKMQPGGTLYAEGLTDARQFHRDVIHGNILGSDIAAWTAYATIFKQSPVGLLDNTDINTPYATPTVYNYAAWQGGGSYTFLNTVPTGTARGIIQQTIWDVVNEQSAYTNVPEPSSLGLLALGGLTLLRRRR